MRALRHELSVVDLIRLLSFSDQLTLTNFGMPWYTREPQVLTFPAVHQLPVTLSCQLLAQL